MALSTVTVTWSEKDPGLSGLTGTITFTLSNRLDDATDGESVNPVPQTYPLSLGISEALVANDNSAALPTGTYYTIAIQSDDGTFYTFQAALNHANGATQKLSSLVPLTTPPALVSSLPLPSGTPAAGQAPIATGTGEASAWGWPWKRVVADTGPSGFALQNATPTILSWTAPNDGKLHSVSLNSLIYVSSTQTGGQINASLTVGGQPYSVLIYPQGANAGVHGMANIISDFVCDPGTTVTLAQSSAQTAGAATLYAQLWAV